VANEPAQPSQPTVNFYDLRELGQKLARTAIDLTRKSQPAQSLDTPPDRVVGDDAAESAAHAARTLGSLAAAIVELSSMTQAPRETIARVKSALDAWVAIVEHERHGK
jgi:hypothetical protein